LDDTYRLAAQIWEEKMTLGQKRCLFTQLLARLIKYAAEAGYGVAVECVRCHLDGHHRKNSLHYLGLAADLNLYKDGVYLHTGAGHDILHNFWDSIGGAKRIANDMNHYSIEHNNMR
jgi:hypothetical protein